MLGEEISNRYRIIQNEARDHASHRFVGTTGSGNDIWLHKAYLDCDVRILTGFIEPHFFAGDFRKAYQKGFAAVRKNAMVAVKKAYDIVITSNSGYPLDLNLYQSIKSISSASRIVKEGGAIIAAADCWDGIPEHGEYAGLLREAEAPQSLLQTIRRHDFAMQDMWQAQIHVLVCLKADVYFHSHNLTDRQVESAFFRPCPNIEATVAELLNKYGREASICVLPDGTQTIPCIAR